MTVLDLFSGIGGFSLGLERAGMKTVAFCEIDPYCRRVLAKHWPGIPCYEDVRTLTAALLVEDGIEIDLICGGFPCQDISVAGKGAGISGARSGLWSEFARIIGEVRPRYVIVENVAALRGRGLSRVLGDLATLGFDAEWHCIPASAVGAPHQRDRVWIIAHATIIGRGQRRTWQSNPTGALADNDSSRLPYVKGSSRSAKSNRRKILGSDAIGCRRDQRLVESDVGGTLDGFSAWLDGFDMNSWCPGWEDGFPRVADGVPNRVDRLRSLGNAVVPQIPELIGRAIMDTAA